MITNAKCDFIIVGAGPSGLTFATLCALNNIKVLLIEKESTIGGCHRVNRVFNKDLNEYIFSEHGPRVYSSSFLNFINILKLIGINFYDYFSLYNFDTFEFARKSIFEIFSLKESLILFSNILFNMQKQKITMKEFMEYYNFSDKAKNHIDGLCRISDGSGYDRYSLEQFIQLINQQTLYKMYQPKMPLDNGLFKYWENFLLNTKNVVIKKSTILNKCIINDKNEIIIVEDINGNKYSGNNIIIACPPISVINIINKLNIPDAFIDFDKFKNFAKKTAYLEYIPIIFHWNEKIELPKKKDFPPSSEWGVIYIELTDYMTFEEKNSKTVVSTNISKTDVISSFLKKTANDCTDEQELINEVLRQLNISIKPTVSIVSPNIYKDLETNTWKNKDTAFFNTVTEEDVYFKSDKYKNLYTVGTHNKNSSYYFTSFESAVSNAIVAFNILNEKNINIKIEKPFGIIEILNYIIIIFISYLLILVVVKKLIIKKNNYIIK